MTWNQQKLFKNKNLGCFEEQFECTQRKPQMGILHWRLWGENVEWHICNEFSLSNNKNSTSFIYRNWFVYRSFINGELQHNWPVTDLSWLVDTCWWLASHGNNVFNHPDNQSVSVVTMHGCEHSAEGIHRPIELHCQGNTLQIFQFL